MPCIEEALKTAEELDDPASASAILVELAVVQQSNGLLHDALAAYQRAVALHRRIADLAHEASALAGVATLYRERGNPVAAAMFHDRAIAIHRHPSRDR